MYSVDYQPVIVPSGIIFAFQSEEMSRLHFSIIFLCGICFANFLMYFSDYFKEEWTEKINCNFKSYSFLPQDSQLRVVDEEQTAVFRRKTELSNEKRIQGL